jgi:hypothetical protein
MSGPEFCPDHWIALLVIIIWCVGRWLHHIPRFTSTCGVTHFYNAYWTAYNSGENSFMLLPPKVYGIAWSLLYPMIAAAVYIFYYYDDVCSIGQYDRGLEIAAWVLIIVNGILNQMWDTVISFAGKSQKEKSNSKEEEHARDRLYRASIAAAIVTVAACLTACAITVIVSIIASENSHKALIASAVFFALYSAWLIVASFVSINFARSIAYKKI